MLKEPEGTDHVRQRVLAIKVEIDWKRDESKALYKRLKDLAWQAARYRNGFVRRMWAEALGYRVAESDDKHGVTKAGRATEKGELSGCAYSAAEREVAGAWARDKKLILAGQPLPEWSPSSALSIRGHKSKKESGVRLELEQGQYVAYLQAQSATCEGGSWLRVPIAKHTTRDEHQGDVLDGMVAWEIPIAKATVQIKQHEIILRLTYAVTVPLPAMGERVATLGPLTRDGRLMLRTETQTKDFSAKVALLKTRKDHWDLTRRRAMRQVGRRKGHARIKRQRIAALTWDDWLTTFLHTWSREIAGWCKSQGVGTIQVAAIDNGDWPAYRFVELLKYKAEDRAMAVTEVMALDRSAERAAKAETRKRHKETKRVAEAVRHIEAELERTA